MIRTLLLTALFLAPVAPQSGVTISGTVTREDQQANPATANQVRLSGPATTIVTIAADGSFEFKNVLPGTYQAVVGPLITMSPVTIVVGTADIKGQKLVIPIVVNVPGTMTVDGAGLRPRFPMVFTPVSGAPVSVLAGATFTAQLPPGEYRIAASGIPAGYTLKSITSGDTDLQTQSLKVGTSDPPKIAIQMGVASPPPWIKLSGHMTGYSPATGFTLSGTSVGETLSATLGSDGAFEFPRVLPGTYSGRMSPLSTANIGTTISIVIGDKDLTNILIAIPAVPSPHAVAGRVVVEGDGPMPRLLAVSFASPVVAPQAATARGGASPAPGTVTVSNTGGSTTASAVLAADGIFSISLPEGEKPVTLVPSTIPPGYKIKSLTYGSLDLLKNPIRIAADDTVELNVTFDATGVTFAKVSGRLVGINPALISGSVSLTGSTSSLPAVDAAINPDGTFAFPKVLQGQYTARLVAPGIAPTAATTTVAVTNKDVTGVEISVPHVISGIVTVDGGGPIPRFTLPLSVVGAGAGTTSVTITAQADGSFRATIPLGERKVGAPTGLPAGYTVKSVMYGATDLLKDTLKVTEADSSELAITLGVAASVPWYNVSGRVNGLTNPLGVRLVLTGTALGSPIETPLGADGAFTVSKLLPGSYVARVSLSGLREVTSSISVGNKDVTGVTIAIPQQYVIAGQVIVDGAPNGFVSPLVALEAKDASGTPASPIATRGGTAGKPFQIELLPGSYKISVNSLPAGYQLKSLIYGTTDLLKEPLKVDGPIPWEIIVRLTR